MPGLSGDRPGEGHLDVLAFHAQPPDRGGRNRAARHSGPGDAALGAERAGPAGAGRALCPPTLQPGPRARPGLRPPQEAGGVAPGARGALCRFVAPHEGPTRRGDSPCPTGTDTEARRAEWPPGATRLASGSDGSRAPDCTACPLRGAALREVTSPEGRPRSEGWPWHEVVQGLLPRVELRGPTLGGRGESLLPAARPRETGHVVKTDEPGNHRSPRVRTEAVSLKS